MSEWRIIHELNDLSPSDWNDLDYNNNPFLSYPFLAGLEQYGCLENQYWQPCHIIIEEKSKLVGFMPLYIKQDSYGEFVFDWVWADAYHHAGRKYYPKLVSAIPFSPVAGQRLLINKKAEKEIIQNNLLSAATTIMNEEKFSSLHILFPDETATEALSHSQGMQRLTIQYHWYNNDYRDFRDFTDTLTSKKRKQILKERRAIKQNNIEIERIDGSAITSDQWRVFYQFYCATFYKKWGEPRLTLDFFNSLSDKLPEQTLLILAKKDGDYIAGAFAMTDSDTLYGRHWGCSIELPFLHFELCYYQTIEHVIEKKLKKLDAGVQGEHKLARGFRPVAMPSSHWIREDDFRTAIRDYLERESNVIIEHVEMLKTHLPFNNDNAK